LLFRTIVRVRFLQLSLLLAVSCYYSAVKVLHLDKKADACSASAPATS
jgi:hypothetical protein